jgi:hypothetical protein
MKTIRTILSVLVIASFMYLAFSSRVPVLAQSHTFAALDVANTFTAPQTFSSTLTANGGLTGTTGLFSGNLTSYGDLFLGNSANNAQFGFDVSGQTIAGVNCSLWGWAQNTVAWLGCVDVSGDIGISGGLASAGAIHATGGLTVGAGGSTINTILTGTGTLSFSNSCGSNCVAANSCAEEDIPVTGASGSGVAFASDINASFSGAPLGSIQVFVGGTNSVTVELCNPTTSNEGTPSDPWKAVVFQ